MEPDYENIIRQKIIGLEAKPLLWNRHEAWTRLQEEQGPSGGFRMSWLIASAAVLTLAGFFIYQILHITSDAQLSQPLLLKSELRKDPITPSLSKPFEKETKTQKSLRSIHKEAILPPSESPAQSNPDEVKSMSQEPNPTAVVEEVTTPVTIAEEKAVVPVIGYIPQQTAIALWGPQNKPRIKILRSREPGPLQRVEESTWVIARISP